MLDVMENDGTTDLSQYKHIIMISESGRGDSHLFLTSTVPLQQYAEQ